MLYLVVLVLNGTGLSGGKVAFHGCKVHVFEQDMQSPQSGEFPQSRDISKIGLASSTTLFLFKIIDGSDKGLEKISETLNFSNTNNMKHIIIESFLIVCS
jgi:hypothetical protein